jgi:hypothetical protein
MYRSEININYGMFKCCFPGCQKIFPVESFVSSTIPSVSWSYLQNEGVGLSYDLVSIDVTCPYCFHTNYFQIKDKVKSISRQEYEELNHSVKSKISQIRVSYKILKINEQVGNTG